MRGTQIKRYSYRRRNSAIGCGVFGLVILPMVLITVCGWLYATGALMPTLFRLVGVQNVGRTETFFSDIDASPTIIVQNPQPPSSPQLTMELGEYGQETISTNTLDYEIILGTTIENGEVASATFTENSLLDLCIEKSDLCNGQHEFLRDTLIDLRPNGAIIYVDVQNGVLWQQIGIVLQLNSNRTSFYLVGVDVGGTIYDPTTLPFGLSDRIGDLLVKAEREGNQLLQQMRVRMDGGDYRLLEVNITDSVLTIIMDRV